MDLKILQRYRLSLFKSISVFICFTLAYQNMVWSSPSSCYNFFYSHNQSVKRDSFFVNFPFGKVIDLKFPNQESLSVAFIGFKGPNYYFYNLKLNQMLMINDQKILSFNAESLENVQQAIKIECQGPGQCAAYSSLHALRVLFSGKNNIKSNKNLQAILDGEPSLIADMDQQFGSGTKRVYTNIPIWKVILGIIDLGEVNSILAQNDSQVLPRQKFLKRLNVKAKETRALSKVTQHLNNGYPVILEGAMKGSWVEVYDHKGILHEQNQGALPLNHGGDRHSLVAASRFLDHKGDGHMIIIDSAGEGNFYVWSDQQLKYFLESSDRNRAVLIKYSRWNLWN
ncbi:MAG: hypothetical protein HUU56_17285 [Bdellovibrionaceae bacterium]|nr:hypothetical protein [Pseudobdellovibrionaceae bacterium]